MSKFRFSVGPWNVHSGADSYGPATRAEIPMEEKFRRFAEIGFSAVQFHDDDAVPEINNYSVDEIKRLAAERKKQLDKYGLAAEFVAPRLWMDPHCVDGGFTSTSEEDREYAMWRAYRSIDIAHELDTDLIVLWLAREGTLCAESKSPVWATKKLIEAIDKMLDYDPNIRVCIEPKPNGKLMTVHLNDQNGIKYDQDKTFGVENLRSAFNQVKVLKENNYGEHGEYVGLDVKAMRTTRDADSFKHLENSLNIFKALEAKVERYDYDFERKCVENRDYEALEMYVMNLVMGLV